MEIKRGASIQGLHISMRQVLMEAEEVWEDFGREEGVTVTSGTEDYAHSAGSLHPYGLALDFRTKYWDRDTQHDVYDQLVMCLPEGFDAVLELNHIHVENDALAKELGC